MSGGDYAPLPIIGLVADVREVGQHPFHMVGEKYLNAVAHGARAMPFMLPSCCAGRDLKDMGALFDPGALLATLDGLFLPGSPSNIAPEHYSAVLDNPDGLGDVQRDGTVLPLVRAAIAAGVPILAVCRGFQELNVALGGTLHQAVHAVSGLSDHREPQDVPRERQYGPAHEVTLAPGGLLYDLAKQERVMVNSVHGQGMDRLAKGLVVEAVAPDGLIEAARLEGEAFVLGVQWHPEWRFWEDTLSLAIFAAFGAAVRARAAQRPQQHIY